MRSEITLMVQDLWVHWRAYHSPTTCQNPQGLRRAAPEAPRNDIIPSQQQLEQDDDTASPALGRLPGWETRSNTLDQEDPAAETGHPRQACAVERAATAVRVVVPAQPKTPS